MAATADLLPEQRQALAYLRRKGTEAPLAGILQRARETFEALDRLLGGLTEERARQKPSPEGGDCGAGKPPV
jgi:hypothetical protein